MNNDTKQFLVQDALLQSCPEVTTSSPGPDMEYESSEDIVTQHIESLTPSRATTDGGLHASPCSAPLNFCCSSTTERNSFIGHSEPLLGPILSNNALKARDMEDDDDNDEANLLLNRIQSRSILDHACIINSNNSVASNNSSDSNRVNERVLKSSWIDVYMKIIFTLRYLILGFTVIVVWPLGIGVAYGRFQSMIDSSFHPMKGSQSDLAAQAFKRAYNNSKMHNRDDGGTDSINSTSTPGSNNIDWNDPMNPPLLILLEENKCQLYDCSIQVGNTKEKRVLMDASVASHDRAITTMTSAQSGNFSLNKILSPMTNDPNSLTFLEAKNFSLGLIEYLMDERCNCWDWPSEAYKYSKNENSTINNGTEHNISSNSYNKVFDSIINNRSSTCLKDNWLQVTSYYSLLDQKLDLIANTTMRSHTGDTALVLVQYTFPDFIQTTKYKNLRILQLMYAIDQYKSDFFTQRMDNTSTPSHICDEMKQPFKVRYTGIKYFASDLLLSTKHDIKRMHVIVLPLALVFIGVVLPASNPVYTWIVPVTTIITTISMWSLMMWALGTLFQSSLQISSFTPTIMMCLSLGMGIDYTLFLLARYLEERVIFKSTKYNSIRNTLLGSGHVLILSGLTLIATFMGLFFLPLSLLQSFGLGASIAVLTSLVVNLTIVPALLYTFIGEKIINPKQYCQSNTVLNSCLSSRRRSNRPRQTVRFTDTAVIEAAEDGPSRDARVTHIDSINNVSNYQQLHLESIIHSNNGRVLSDNDRPIIDDEAQNSASPAPHQQEHHPSTTSKQSFWHRLSQHLLHPYKGVIILLITFQILYPIAKNAGRVKSSLSFDLLLPSKSPALQAFHDLEMKVGGSGRLNPYRILFDGHAANISMTSDLGFEIMHLVVSTLQLLDDENHMTIGTSFNINHQNEFAQSFVKEFSNETTYDHVVEMYSKEILNSVESNQRNTIVAISNHDKSHTCINDKNRRRDVLNPSVDLNTNTNKRKPTVYNGISVLQNNPIPHFLYVSAKSCGNIKPYCPVQLLHALDEIDRSTTSSDFMATYVTATIMNSSPFSNEGIQWLEDARATLERLQSSNSLHGVEVYMEGSAAIAQDAISGVYKAFPAMLAITTMIIFALMGIFFRSVIPPLRSIISISITTSFSFGLAVLVFQDGIWKNYTTFTRMWASTGDEMCWLVPIMAFSIIVGLALDYDIFLISRILEYRLQYHEHKTSIANGLQSTGSIITAAGLIMVVAFGSLLFSSNPGIYQWSFLLTTAVLLDTFVIRTIVVPVLTNLAGPKYCWWPRYIPPSTIVLLEYRPLLDPDDVAGLLETLEQTSEYEPLHI